MAMVEVVVNVDGDEVGRFGVNAQTTPECSIYQQVVDAITNAGVRLLPKTVISFTVGDNHPRIMQYKTLARHLDDCEDVVV